MKDTERIRQFLSSPRLGPYVHACKGDLNASLELYQVNVRLSASFWPLLSMLEVSLRNALDREFSHHFGTKDWFEPLETLLRTKGEEKIRKLERKLGPAPKGYRQKEPLLHTAGKIKGLRNSIISRKENNLRNGVKIELRKTPGFSGADQFQRIRMIDAEFAKRKAVARLGVVHSDMISEATFSFWTSLFKNEVYSALKGLQIRIFSNRRPDIKAKDIAWMLDSVRRYRNRIAHNEPLCFSQGRFDLTGAQECCDYTERLLFMLNEKLEEYTQAIYMIHESINDAKSFISVIRRLVSANNP